MVLCIIVKHLFFVFSVPRKLLKQSYSYLPSLFFNCVVMKSTFNMPAEVCRVWGGFLGDWSWGEFAAMSTTGKSVASCYTRECHRPTNHQNVCFYRGPHICWRSVHLIRIIWLLLTLLIPTGGVKVHLTHTCTVMVKLTQYVFIYFNNSHVIGISVWICKVQEKD